MALEQRIESLKKRHEEIEALLHQEETRPAKDEAKIHQLKQDKLKLKDELSKLTSELQDVA